MKFLTSSLVAMAYFYKTVFCFILISLSFTTYGENIVSPISVADLPNNIQDKSPQELSDIMSHIAGWSYQVLLKVPAQGLKNQQDFLKQIITLRKWLQAQQHPLFQLLAIELINGVDSSVLNEINRYKRIKYPDSFDSHLLNQLFSSNEIDESALIEYALSLDGQIATYGWQQNYTPEDYLNESAMAYDMLDTEIRNYLDIWENKIFNPVFFKFSKSLINDIVFIRTLEIIDRKRDIRILMEVYFESGFPDNRKDFRSLVAQKLLPEQFRVRTGMAVSAFEVITSLEDYGKIGYSPSHGLMISGLLFPYLSGYEIMPEEYHDNFGEPFKNCIGNRLIYLEDMTPAEKDKLQGCIIIDSIDAFQKL